MCLNMCVCFRQKDTEGKQHSLLFLAKNVPSNRPGVVRGCLGSWGRRGKEMAYTFCSLKWAAVHTILRVK